MNSNMSCHWGGGNMRRRYRSRQGLGQAESSGLGLYFSTIKTISCNENFIFKKYLEATKMGKYTKTDEMQQK